jgi:hypothetical protein
MAKLYREHVLKEKPAPELVRLIPPTPMHPRPATDKEEAVGSFGD